MQLEDTAVASLAATRHRNMAARVTIRMAAQLTRCSVRIRLSYFFAGAAGLSEGSGAAGLSRRSIVADLRRFSTSSVCAR